METLNLTGTELPSIDQLLTTPHNFPNLHTLILCDNHLTVRNIDRVAAKFPNLKVLELDNIQFNNDDKTFKSFGPHQSQQLQSTQDQGQGQEQQQPQQQPPQQHYLQLKKLSLQQANVGHTITPLASVNLSRSPHLTQLEELRLRGFEFTGTVLSDMFDEEECVWKIWPILIYSRPS